LEIGRKLHDIYSDPEKEVGPESWKKSIGTGTAKNTTELNINLRTPEV